MPSGRGAKLLLLSAPTPRAVPAVISTLEIIRLANLFMLMLQARGLRMIAACGKEADRESDTQEARSHASEVKIHLWPSLSCEYADSFDGYPAY